MINVSNEANWNTQQTLTDKKTTLNLDQRKEYILSTKPELKNCQSADILVALTDQIISNNYGQQKNPGERKMLCTKTAVVLKVLTGLTGTWEADFPEISELNYLRGVEIEDSFYDHTPVILKDINNSEKYVVDLTFSQFIDPETGKIKHKNKDGVLIETTVRAEDNELIKELLKKGYFDFNKLTDYLNLTVRSESRDDKGNEFWRDYYNQLDMESFSSESDIDEGCKEIEKYLEHNK